MRLFSIFFALFFILIYNIIAQPTLKPSIGLNSLPADADSVCDIPWYLGSFFTSGLQKNDTAYDFKLYDLNGDSLVLSSALNTKKPVLLIAGSYTCPVFMGKIPKINQVISTYGNQLQVYVVYVVEAHPDIDTSVYFGYVNTGQQNINAGILYRQPQTYGDRKQIVQDMLTNNTLNAPVFIDGPCNYWWSTYGPAPNNSYLIDTNGIVFSKHGWFDRFPDNIYCSIDSLLGTTSGNCTPQSGGNGTFTFNLIGNDTVYGQAGTTLTINGELINNSNNNIPIYVRRLINNMPSGWASSLCIDVCYSTTTDSVVFLLPAKDTQEFHFYFYSTPSPLATGYARVGFRNNNNTSNMFIQNMWGITNNTTAIKEENEELYNIYPNPTNGQIHFSTTSNKYTVELYDMLGKKILNEFNPKTIDVSNFNKGTYMIRIYNENKVYSHKIIIQ